MDVVLCGAFGPGEREEWLNSLSAACPAGRWLDIDAARQSAATVRAAVVFPPVGQALQGLPKLGLIQSLFAGVDRLLGEASLPADVPLARMVDPAMGRAMAETALWATLALQRHFFAYARQQADRAWRPLPQRRADGWRVSVLGLGEMGRAVAATLAQQGYAVSGWAARPRAQPRPDLPTAFGDEGLLALLPRTDVLINLLPLTAATRGLLDQRLFARLPAGASVVNLARGAHVVDVDLLAALDAGHLSHAVLDVFDSEPLPAAHPYWSHPRVTVLPHVAALTDPRSAAEVVAANLNALDQGRPLRHLVNRRRGY